MDRTNTSGGIDCDIKKNSLDHLGKLRQLSKMYINTGDNTGVHPGAKNASHTCVGMFFAENLWLRGEREIVGMVRNVGEVDGCSK